MLSAFRTISEKAGLFREDSKILLAVSGGIDSMCMASLFLEAGLRFAVAHCNFHLRGEESDRDEALVRQWTENQGIEFHKTDFDTLSFARERGISVEMAARELRYTWFVRLCKESGFNKLAIAHNANDNAETLLLNIVRGTGMNGLSGMSRLSPIPYSCHGATSGFTASLAEGAAVLVRPMLDFTRKQIEGYVRSHSVPYREDSTNSETEYKRNCLRHNVLPVLERLNPSFVKTVNREMGYFSAAASIARSYSESVLKKAVSEDGLSLDLTVLEAEAHRDYILYVYLSGFGFNSSVISSVCDLLSSGGTMAGKVFKAEKYELLTGSGRLIIRGLQQYGDTGESRGTAECATGVSGRAAGFADGVHVGTAGCGGGVIAGAEAREVLEISGDGDWTFNGRSFRIQTLKRSEIKLLKQPEGVLIFDASVLKYPFYFRSWQAGDWFRPLGGGGRKKLSDFFTDKKYDRYRKAAAVILVQNLSDSHVAAVIGERMDDAYKITDSDYLIMIS